MRPRRRACQRRPAPAEEVAAQRRGPQRRAGPRRQSNHGAGARAAQGTAALWGREPPLPISLLFPAEQGIYRAPGPGGGVPEAPLPPQPSARPARRKGRAVEGTRGRDKGRRNQLSYKNAQITACHSNLTSGILAFLSRSIRPRI